MGSSGDSEKIIQRLNDELREAQELANTEKHKCIELQGETPISSHHPAHTQTTLNA